MEGIEMTISKERFEQIALEIENQNDDPYWYMNDTAAYMKWYAHALIKAVQDESEVVVYQHFEHDYGGKRTGDYRFGGVKPPKDGGYDSVKLIALPLVSEE